MKIRTRLFLIMLSVSLVPLFLITALAYSRYKSTTHDRMDEISANMFSNAQAEFNKTVNGVEQSAGMFTFYSDNNFSIVQNLVSFADPAVTHSQYEILAANRNIQFVCKNILYSYNYIYGLYVFTPSGAILSSISGANGDLLYGYNPVQDDWYSQTLDKKGKFYISAVEDHTMFSGHHQSLFFSKALYDVYSHQFLGVLLIDCSPTMFDLTTVNTLPDITSFQLCNTDGGNILYEAMPEAFSTNSNADMVTRQGKLTLPELQLTATFDYSALYREFSFTGILLLAVAAICAVGILLIAYVLSQYVTSPIEHLSRKMVSQHGSHLMLTGHYLARTDEIGTLFNGYNAMVEDLNASVKRDYEDKLIALDAQMRSLEAQIDSHFLFNTLESINSLAELDDDPRISTMVMSLGSMFRYTIKTPSEIVTVEQELEHVHNYVSIQKIRYDNRFSFKVEMPAEVRACRVLKLILQPLVENSFRHGLNSCTSGNLICITGWVEAGSLYLSVADNGVGIPAAELAALRERLAEPPSFSELGHRTRQSIGLKNIHTRIELYYGKGYGLQVFSPEGQGTTVKIRLPLAELPNGEKEAE